MKNLKICEHRKDAVAIAATGRVCNDALGSVFFVNTNGIETLKMGTDGGYGLGLYELIWTDHEIETSEIIGADIITTTNCMCVVTREGDVITVNSETHEVEVGGSVSAGLEASCWSPDQELLVLITGDGNVIIMTADLDPISEFPMSNDDFGENQFVNVGWGKKETQFHGKDGKVAAKVISTDIKPVSEWDDLKPRISWRGDGQLFVISYVAKETGNRVLRTVNREGILQYTSEYVDGLEHALSWKPSGSLVASSQRLANKHVIVFFEKNGLKHGEFTLPFKPDEVTVKEVMWNQDSSTLLVWLQKGKKGDDQSCTEIVQLWTTGNYHWYLKQELQFPDGIVSLYWDVEYPLVLHVLTPKHLHRYSCATTANISQGVELTDLAQVAVVDGCVLKITPFRQCVVPPPMSAYEVRFEHQIHAVLYAPSIVKKCEVSPENSDNVEDSGFLEVIDPPGCSSNNLCVVHGCNTLTFLVQAHANDNLDDFGNSVKVTGSGGNGFAIKVKVHRVIAQHSIEWESEVRPKSLETCQFYNWVWVEKKTILACYMEDDNCFLVVMELQSIGSEAARVVVKTVVPVEDSVVNIAPAPDGTIACLQLFSGALLRFDVESKEIEPYIVNGKEASFPNVCQQVSLIPVEGEDVFMPIGLTSRNRLYMASEQIFANCTSYHIHTDHLLVTTTNHLLQVIPLSHAALRKVVEGQSDDNSVVGTRKVERGSRLVTAVPQDTRVFLQMPRGNLEVVSPRPLSVHILKHLLDEHKYHTAFDMMRKQRIDLNLLYDHNPEEFMSHTAQFVQSVDNAQWLDLFLANLNECDVTKTMYSFNYSKANVFSRENVVDKINSVCCAVRDSMTSVDQERYLLPILTSYIKMNPSQMDVALRKIEDMKDSRDKKFKVSAEEGLRHLLYISDVNELYDVALGTYDFDLVMMVAEKSQKDPKEYLPFLNELKQLEENYMKYKINVHLRKFRRALECLQDVTDHQEECLNLIISQKLYKEALQVFPPSSSINKAVCENYGHYLMSKKYHNEASVMYTRAEAFNEALDAYQQAGNWRMMLVMCSRLKYNREKVVELCNSQVEIMKERREYGDAAVIYEEYLKNEEEAVECLVKGCQWDDALRIAYKYGRADLVDTNISPGVLEQYEFCSGEVERFSKSFTEFCDRLIEVRKIKEKQLADFLEGKDEAQLDSDLYSDTSTVTGFSYSRSHASSSRTGSSVSGRTYRSTKNRKKLERKKHSTREGSSFEDLGLVTALHEIMTQTDHMTAQITSLTTILVTFGMDKKAGDLQSNFLNLLTTQAKRERDIWPVMAASEENEVEFGPQVSTDGALNLLRGNGNVGDVSLVMQRMKSLQSHLQHAPIPTRSQNWELHMLRREK